MIPYQFQLPHPQHVAPPPPVIPSLSQASVLTYSQGETGATSGNYITSTARPLVPYSPPKAISPISEYAPPKQIAPLRFTSQKTHVTIEPQLIVGPISLPPTIETTYQNQEPHYGYRYTQPYYPMSYGLSYTRGPNHIVDSFGPSALFLSRHKSLPSHSGFSSVGYSHSYNSPLSNYNTIAYSVPYSHKFKRDAKKQ